MEIKTKREKSLKNLTPEEKVDYIIDNGAVISIYKNGIRSPREALEDKETVAWLAMAYQFRVDKSDRKKVAKAAKGQGDPEFRELVNKNMYELAYEAIRRKRIACKVIEENKSVEEATKETDEEMKNEF